MFCLNPASCLVVFPFGISLNPFLPPDCLQEMLIVHMPDFVLSGGDMAMKKHKSLPSKNTLDNKQTNMDDTIRYSSRCRRT